VVTVSGKGSGRVSVAGLICLKAGARSHLFYRMRIHRGRKGERRRLSEADYAGLIAAAHNQLIAIDFTRLPIRCASPQELTG
jgi:putative transposase